MNAKSSRAGRILRHFAHWDFIVSLGLATTFLILVLRSDRPIEDATGPLGVAVGLGVTVAVGAAVAGRWLADRIKDDAYGEVLRALDPDESSAQAPFRLVSIIGIATSVGAVILLVTRGELNRTWTAVAYAGELVLALYGLFGLLDLLLQTHRHQRRQARLRAIREEENRRNQQ